MRFENPPTHPIEILSWEHRLMIDGYDRLLSRICGSVEIDSSLIVNPLEKLMRVQESHQEAEERFLFPLVSESNDALISELRQEHAGLFRGSDVVESFANLKDVRSLVDPLTALRSELIKHFRREEEEIFKKAALMLTPAKSDILKIKFATRSVGLK